MVGSEGGVLEISVGNEVGAVVLTEDSDFVNDKAERIAEGGTIELEGVLTSEKLDVELSVADVAVAGVEGANDVTVPEDVGARGGEGGGAFSSGGPFEFQLVVELTSGGRVGAGLRSVTVEVVV